MYSLESPVVINWVVKVIVGDIVSEGVVTNSDLPVKTGSGSASRLKAS